MGALGSALTWLVRVLIKIALALSALVLVTLSVVYALLWTGVLNNSLDAIVNQLARADDGFYVHVESLKADPLEYVRANKVELGDRDGVWMTIEDIAIHWNPFDIFHPLDADPLRINVNDARARRLEWTRLERDPLVEDDDPFRWDEFVRLVVGSLEIDRFELRGEILGGSSAAFRGVAGGVLGEWEHGFLILDLERLDGPKGNLHVDLTTGGSPITLNGTLTADEGPAGALAALARLPEAGAVKLQVTGSGALRDWNAKVDLSASQLGTLRGETQISFGDEGAFSVDASVDPLASVRETFLVGKGAPILVSAKGALIPDVELRLDELLLSADGREIVADGKLEFEGDQVVAQARLGHSDRSRRMELTELGFQSAYAKLSGVLADLGHLDASMEFQELAVGEVTAGELTVKLKAKDPAGDGPASFELAADASGLKLSGDVFPLVGESATLRSTGRFDADTGAITANKFLVDGGAVTLSGPVALSDEGQTVETSLSVEVRDLASLTQVLATTVQGSVTAKIDARGTGGLSALDAKLTANAVDVAVGEAGWNALLAGESSLEANWKGALAGPGHADVKFTALGVTATGAGDVGAGGEDLVADLTVLVDNLGRLAEPTRAAIAGRLESKLSARGSMENFDLSVSVRGDQFSYEGSRFDSLAVNVEATGLPEVWNGNLRAHAKYGNTEASLDTELEMPDAERFVVRGLKLRGPGTQGTADLDVDLASSTASGSVRLRGEDLSLWRSMTGVAVGGSVDVDAVLAVAGSSANAEVTQQIGGTISVKKGVFGFGDKELFLDAVDASADALEVGPAPRGTVGIRVSRVRYGGTTLVEGGFDAKGDGKQWAFDTRIHLLDGEELHLKAAATLRPAARAELTVSRMEASVAELPVVLSAPAVVRFERDGSSDTWSLDPTAIRIGEDGLLEGKADSVGGRLRADVRTVAFPLESLSVLFPEIELLGTADATFQFDGSDLGSATAELSLHGNRVTSSELVADGVSPLDVVAQAHLLRGRVVGSANVGGLRDTTLSVTVDIPAVHSETAPVSANLTWKGNVQEMFALVPTGDDVLSGHMDADVRLGGTMAAPRVTGRVLLDGGVWENAAMGLVLKDISAELVGSGASLELTKLSATDGAKGTVTGSGRVHFDVLPNFDAAFDVEATDAMLARLDVVTAKADAAIALRLARVGGVGAPITGTISGSVNVEDARVQIPQRFAADIPEIEVIDVTSARGLERVAGDRAAESLILLDVLVVANNRIFVDGRGLQSEWASDLRIGGNVRDVRMTGTITSVRGDLSLLGRRFEVSKATVRFDGAKGNIPYLALTARADANDITAIAVVTGSALRPSIDLRSEPSLPRDEVLSRVLFGQSASSLTPMQSVQLARSVAELTGSSLGGGGSILDGIGSTLGFDRLELGGGEGGAALTASKYITDGVYLRVQQGLTPETSKVSLEWQIFNHITIESDISQDAQGEVGATWRWDY